MTTIDPANVPPKVLANVLAEMYDHISETVRGQMRQLYSAQDGIAFSVDSRNRPQGPTIYASRKIGTEVRRRLGYDPKYYGMSFIGHNEGLRWFMNRNVRKAISMLGWFDGMQHMAHQKNPQKLPPQFFQETDFELAVNELLRKKNLPRPIGIKAPAKSTVTTTRVVRDPSVAAWVLQQAKGRCDCCRKAAPFRDVNNIPFLEVHHLRRLADGGADTPENAVAVCPNCHRELHHGKQAVELVTDMYLRIKRLEECIS